jgi:hypothetical protein
MGLVVLRGYELCSAYKHGGNDDRNLGEHICLGELERQRSVRVKNEDEVDASL